MFWVNSHAFNSLPLALSLAHSPSSNKLFFAVATVFHFILIGYVKLEKKAYSFSLFFIAEYGEFDDFDSVLR